MQKTVVNEGDVFGQLTVITEISPSVNKNGYSSRVFLCQCSCGVIEDRKLQSLKDTNDHYCRECAKERLRYTNYLDISSLIGHKYGKLTIIKDAGYISHISSNVRAVLCLCDCGNETIVGIGTLRQGGTKSCGCGRKGKTSHGLSKHPLYRVFNNMKTRCYNNKTKNFHRYGGRGIIICDEWLNDFNSFYTWALSNGWAYGLQIDRINNDGNYEPLNCRWTIPVVQSNNRSDNIKYYFKGEFLTITQICRILGITDKIGTIRSRLDLRSMTLELALNYNYDYRGKRHK